MHRPIRRTPSTRDAGHLRGEPAVVLDDLHSHEAGTPRADARRRAHRPGTAAGLSALIR